MSIENPRQEASEPSVPDLHRHPKWGLLEREFVSLVSEGLARYMSKLDLPTPDGELSEVPGDAEMTKAANTRPLVGPAPKVEELPKYQAKFEARDEFVYDATGDTVLGCYWGDKTYEERVEFAAYVAAALNARVFGEE